MKSVTGALIRPDRIERVAVRSIEEMQAAVGGWVEALSLDYATAYFDGDGRMKNLPYNVVGSLLCGRDILGNVLVLGRPTPEGHDTSLDERHIEELLYLARAAGQEDV